MTNASTERETGCRHQDMRRELARALLENRHLESREEDPPLRDRYGRYSVTGMAAESLTPAVWVWSQGNWRYFHPQEIPESIPAEHPIRAAARSGPTRELEMTPDTLTELEDRPGSGQTRGYPEWVAEALGIPGGLGESSGIEIDPETGHAGRLDDLGFTGPSELLRESPELIGECGCRSREG